MARVEVLSTFAVSTPVLPKSSVDALLITHEEVSVICTVNVDVAVAALEELVKGRKNSAATASFRPVWPIIGGKQPYMISSPPLRDKNDDSL